ncbi:sdo1 [Hyphodiscus hymeniophilus]|uniref:Sdo1 n=1 Tax=Hyphodiscus hymeniophilus TaxID=353542 RepID=A0A9P7AZD3_9HELO|nr:sdo1 [Hyphodiscus hymeniophilus]
MTKGEAQQTKVHFKGKEDDFIVFVDDAKALKDWKSDKSIPLTQFVGSFKVFVSHKHGAQGQLDSASKSTLENEFGSAKEDEVIIQILEKGTVQESEFPERQGNKNDSMGSRGGH